MSAPEYLKKISTTTIGLMPKQMSAIALDEKFEGKPIPVMRVYGTIKAMKDGITQFGPFTSFQGEFEAINLATQKKFRSKTMLVPELGTQMLSDALSEAKAVSSDAFIQFGLDITVEENKSGKGGVPYKWGIIPVKQPDFKGENDALSLFGKSLGEPSFMLAPPASGKAKKS
jgi:hypothetical protein